MEIHPTAVKEETGFSVIEMLLCLIIVSLITFVGYYIYSTQKSANATYKAASIAAQASAPKTTKKPSASTANWLLYTAPGKEYSIRLADGWKFERYQKSSTIYSGSNANLTPTAGTKATVTEVQGGKDGLAEGMSVFSAIDSAGISTDGYTLVSAAKTDTGLTYQVYTQTQTTTANALGALFKGGTYYQYVVSKPGTHHTVVVAYGVNPGQQDFHADVEAAVKTVAFN